MKFVESINVITFRVRRSRGVAEAKCIVVMAVCVPVCPSPHSHTTDTDPHISCRNSRGFPVFVHYSADLQSVHEFRCYDKHSAEREMSASACTRSMPVFLYCGWHLANNCTFYKD